MQLTLTGRAFFIALFGLSLYLMYLVFKPFLAGIAWATVLVVVFYPAFDELLALMRGRRLLAAISMTLLLTTLIVLPLVLVMMNVGQGLVESYQWLEQQHAAGQSAIVWDEQFPWLEALREWATRTFGIDRVDLRAMAATVLRTSATYLASTTADFVKSALSTVLTLGVLLVTTGVLFYEGPRVLHAVRRLLPLSETDRDAVLHQLWDLLRAVFLGVLATALVQGLVSAIGYAIVGLPFPVGFGAATFFCALLPLGTGVVWLPAAGWLFATGHPWKALILVAWGALLVASVDNVLRPMFIGRGATLHALVVFFGLFGGITAFGLVGLFVGPLVITLFLFLIEVLRRDIVQREDAPH